MYIVLIVVVKFAQHSIVYKGSENSIHGRTMQSCSCRISQLFSGCIYDCTLATIMQPPLLD